MKINILTTEPISKITHNAIQRTLLEYAVRQDNFLAGSGKGGNRNNLFKLLNCEISINNILGCDRLILSRMADGKQNIMFNTFAINKIPIKDLLTSLRSDLDYELESINNLSKLNDFVSAQNICSNILDNVKDNLPITNLVKELSKYDVEIQLISIRERIGIVNIIKYNLDEGELLPMLDNINNIFRY